MSDTGAIPSQFDARADSAALALRQTLKGQGREMPDEASVEVGPNGQPPAQLPPQGSYARQALEIQQRQQVGDQPPAGTAEQVLDGSMAPKLQPSGQPPHQPPAEATSPRAEQRIKDLVEKLRKTEQDLQLAVQNGQTATETANGFQQRLSSLETQHQEMLQANMDHLDPETRMQVIQDARFNQFAAGLEERIMGRIQPQLGALETQGARAEMQALSETYPAFDLQIHGPLVDMFRGKNPHCTIEQAFRAIATPDEVVTRAAVSASAVPPTLAPGNGELAGARYAPQPEPQSTTPEQEMVTDANRIAELRRSTDPAKQKEGLDLIHRNLSQRLG